MGPMLFNWQNNVPKKSAKRIKHKKRHETQIRNSGRYRGYHETPGLGRQRTPYRIYCTCVPGECQGKIHKCIESIVICRP